MAPGISFDEIDSLPDPLNTDRFLLDIEPRGSGGASAMQALQLRCQQVVMPGAQIEPVLVALHGHTHHWRGRKVYPFTMGISFVETKDGIVYTTLKTWHELIVGSNSGNGVSKREYVTRATLRVLDEGGNVAHTCAVDNLWPTDVPDVQLDGTGAQPMLIQVTFQYDRSRLESVRPS